MQMSPSADLTEVLRTKFSRAKCLWDIGRQELSALPYAHEAAPGALIAVVRTFTTDPRAGVVMNDTHAPAFCIKHHDGEDLNMEYADIDPEMRRLAGPIYTSQRTDPHLRAWVESRIKIRCPDTQSVSETVEVYCLRDAVVLHDHGYIGWPMHTKPRDHIRQMLKRVDVVFPDDLSNHALLSAICGVEAYLSGLIYSTVGQEYGLSPEETRVALHSATTR